MMNRMLKSVAVFCAALVIGQSSHAAWNQDDAVRIRWEEKGEYPSFVRFQSGKGPKLTELYPYMKEMLGLGAQDLLRLKRTTLDKLGFTHYEFEQLHEGFPVAYATYKAHFRNGVAESMNGRVFKIGRAATQSVSEQQALALALAQVDAESYMWEIPGEVAALRYATGDPNANFLPLGKLVWVKDPSNVDAEHRLAWHFDIYAHHPIARKEVYLDASTGEAIFIHDLIHTGDANGTAVTFYSGVQSIVSDSTGTGYRLRESGRAQGVETYNMQNGTDYFAAVDFEDADNYWDNVNANTDQAATDGHWGAEMTYDYFFLRYGRNSFDGNGSKLLSYIHYDQGYANAFWDGTRMTYGSSGNNLRPFCALDVCAHEFSHGVTGTSAGLIYAYEPGALNESFSDIFGVAIEFYARPNDANWMIGEDIGGIRNMANPAQYSNPDTYLGQFWTTGSFDNGGVHNNSGVQNYWFYLLSVGGSGTNDIGNTYSVSGLGIDTAGMIAFRNLTTYLTQSDQYADARYYSIEAAIDLFGECSNEVIQTVNAWYAVGVGNPYTGVLEAGFYTPDTNNCSIPATVNFHNNSISAFSYHWDFGDGDTSIAENPSHVYQSAGTYTVTLIATGCLGVRDTLVMTNHVVLDPNAPCVINMPGGSGSLVHEGCEGELFDSGGNGNYLDNTFSTTTIMVPQGSVVYLNFQSFGFLAGDNIRIFDGDSINDPVIGIYNGTNLPPSVVSSTNALTIRESTNGFGGSTGFHAVWSCAVSNSRADVSGLNVYPNPAQGSAMIELLKAEPFTYQLMDMQGKTLRQGDSGNANRMQIDLNSLSKGVYFVNVYTAGQRYVRKLVVE